MKATVIKQEMTYFTVSLEYNLFERLFGYRNKTKKFKDSGREYVYGGGTIYYDETGNKTENGSTIGEAIDLYRIVKRF